MKTYILILYFFLITGCVSSMQNASTSTSTSSIVKSISSPGGISGMWKGSFERAFGLHQSASFEFNQNRDTLTGTLIYGKNSTTLLNGKIEGNKITFRTIVKGTGGSVKSYWEGTVNGDQLRITCHADTGENAKGILRRVN